MRHLAKIFNNTYYTNLIYIFNKTAFTFPNLMTIVFFDKFVFMIDESRVLFTNFVATTYNEREGKKIFTYNKKIIHIFRRFIEIGALKLFVVLYKSAYKM